MNLPSLNLMLICCKICPVLKWKRFRHPLFGSNTYVLYDDEGKAAIVDPTELVVRQSVLRFISSEGLEPQVIINTHGHWDHISGNRLLKYTFGIPIAIHSLDREFPLRPDLNLGAFLGKFQEQYDTSPPADISLQDGDRIFHMEVIHTPGHTPGSICLAYPGRENPSLLLSGDTLFMDSIGRVDLPMGSEEEMLKSLRRLIKILNRNTLILPGHGEVGTWERLEEENAVLREFLNSWTDS